MGNRVLAAVCALAAVVAGCGGDDADEREAPASAPDPRPAETSATTAPAETSAKAEPAELAADVLKRHYPAVVASSARTRAERERLRREVASYETLETSCSPTKRRGVFNCVVRFAPRGYAPNIEHLRVTLFADGKLEIRSQPE